MLARLADYFFPCIVETLTLLSVITVVVLQISVATRWALGIRISLSGVIGGAFTRDRGRFTISAGATGLWQRFMRLSILTMVLLKVTLSCTDLLLSSYRLLLPILVG